MPGDSVNVPTPTKLWRPTATLLILFAYGVVRNRIYHAFPALSLKSWFVRDAWMTVPRLAGFLAIYCIWSGWKISWTRARSAPITKSLTVSVGAIAAWFFYFLGSRGERFTPEMAIIGIFTSAAVALFEEYAFRGPLLAELSARFSIRWGVIITSLLFTLYHYQAQGLGSWPSIFLTGVTFAGLRCLGVSLLWLVLLHTIIDAGFLFFPSENPPALTLWALTRALCLLACALIVFFAASPKSDIASPPTLT